MKRLSLRSHTGSVWAVVREDRKHWFGRLNMPKRFAFVLITCVLVGPALAEEAKPKDPITEIASAVEGILTIPIKLLEQLSK